MNALILCATLALAAPPDLRPRQGSGWEGFKAGTWVKIKMTSAIPGRAPSVAITTYRLKEIRKTDLVVSTVTKYALGVPERKGTDIYPRKGEAGKGEKATVKKLDPLQATAARKVFACAVTQTTVTGASGKRIIEEWRAADPKVRVKRLEKVYDKRGELTLVRSLQLDALATKRIVGKKTVLCLRYTTMTSQGTRRVEGSALTSRDVPGGGVLETAKIYERGKMLMEIRREVLAFEAK